MDRRRQQGCVERGGDGGGKIGDEVEGGGVVVLG